MARNKLPDGEALRRRRERAREDQRVKRQDMKANLWRNMITMNAVREIIGLDPIPYSEHL